MAHIGNSALGVVDNKSLLNNMEEIIFTKIMVEMADGTVVNITDLPRLQYEYFLKLMHDLEIAYRIKMAQLDRRQQTKE